LKRALALLLVVGASGCASGRQADVATLASSSDQVVWEAAQKAVEKKEWEPARQYFKRIIDGFPQSEFGPAARLGLADSHFTEGGAANYVLATSEYRDFVTLYPSHPRSDYAQFQIGECFFRQRNSADRDQTSTIKSLAEYERLLEAYPSSQYAEQTRARIGTCRQSLARADFMAGLFYQRTRRAYRAAASRYQAVLDEYPDYDSIDEVLFRISQVLYLSGRVSEALPHLSKLLEVYPASQWADDARELLSEIQKNHPVNIPPGAPQPAPEPAPSPGSPAAPVPEPTPPSSMPAPPLPSPAPEPPP
jgi:outer membrane protein assembly factor BamD